MSKEAEPDDGRETWGKKIDFLLSVIGFAVDLANVWRFPYLCYKNGGGAFLIPYGLMLLLGGIPLFYMELALGQFNRTGAITCWGRLCPLFKGIGWSVVLIAFYTDFYYNVIIAWSLHFLFKSFTSTLPWSTCGNDWNTEHCYEGFKRNNSVMSNDTDLDYNITTSLEDYNISTSNITNITGVIRKSPAEEYFVRGFLGLHESSGIFDVGYPQWQIVLCLLGVYLICYFSLWKGISTSGKVVWFTALFPYVVLFILMIRGATLPGAATGIEYYLTPNFTRLATSEVWVDAATQVFFSLGPGFGVLLAFASYNQLHNNVYRDALLTSSINCATSFFSGFVIFMILGYMAQKAKVHISQVATEGPGLVFMVYPEAIATLPGAPFWAIIFFLMLLTLGLDSSFGGSEAVLTALSDEFPILKKYRELFVGALFSLYFIVGLSFCTQGGAFVVNLMDKYAAGYSILFAVFFESLVVSWAYGVDRFSDDIRTMIGYKPGLYWKVCWKFIAPFIMIFGLVGYQPLKYDDYEYPWSANFIGWCVACSSILCIPGFALYGIITTPGTLTERFQYLITPTKDRHCQVTSTWNDVRVNGERTDNKICINVGGVRFVTKKDTFNTLPDTKLFALYENFGDYYDQNNKEFFFDCDPNVFASVLGMYRNGSLHIPQGLCGVHIKEELSFWGISETNIRKGTFIRHTVEKELILPFFAIDRLFNFIFGIEFILRFLACPKKKKFFTFLNFAEFISIIGFSLTFHLGKQWSSLIQECGDFCDLTKLRDGSATLFYFLVVGNVLLVFRNFRFFMIGRLNSGFNILLVAVRRSKRELLVFTITILFNAMIFAGFIFYAEDEESIANFFDACYWAIVTMTTVGYGDIRPKYPMGKFVAALCSISGLFLLTMPVSVISGNFNQLYRRYNYIEYQNKSKKKNQIVCGGYIHEAEPDDGRETWGKKIDFLLSVIGFAVDLANVWRFPYLCYKNGGGAFLIPYGLMLLLGGIPLFYMELALGQFNRTGAITCWGRLCPLFKGIGWSVVLIAFYTDFYYNVIIAWSLHFLFKSFTSTLPWSTCGNDWNTEHCYEGFKRNNSVMSNDTDLDYNITTSLEDYNISTPNITNITGVIRKSPAEEYFVRGFLGLHESSGIFDVGYPQWQIVLCLLGVYLICYFSLWKGISTSGKVVWFTALFPYVVLFILMIRGATLPGAATGIEYYLTPNFTRLATSEVWVDAATQVFFSLGPGFGVLLAFASYNQLHNNVYRDALLTSSINCATSFFSGFVIFMILGYMAQKAKVHISQVATEGPGLVFMVYPEAIATLPGAPFWAIIFFLMLLTLGLDSSVGIDSLYMYIHFGGSEAVLTALSDEFPILKKYRELFVGALFSLYFIVGLSFCTQGGAFVVNLMDKYAAGYSILFAVFFESLVVSWAYVKFCKCFVGVDRFSDDIRTMIGYKPGLYWKVCWKFIAPFIMIFGLVGYQPLKYDDYEYPWSANFIGWCVACSSILCIPGFALYGIITTPGTLTEFCLKMHNIECLYNSNFCITILTVK
ncbi:LOW QUALITY PROTEIN: hypothetical protein KUTeg_010213 [Tegillarca granosa]|uniref:Transporter n=1 Tax=Tegillarca granosa TaxID=220873 RepID=A0ABQ9FB38_TEGGR|nr:LOW QUALITY PROTEIN: hypothetical protein KUTeg_010213 [Tegillarca granosa]